LDLGESCHGSRCPVELVRLPQKRWNRLRNATPLRHWPYSRYSSLEGAPRYPIGNRNTARQGQERMLMI
jgi:hypothetical protein